MEVTKLKHRNAPDPLWMSSLNTTNIGRIERGLVVMGCVVDVIRVYTVLNEDMWKNTQGHSKVE